MDHDYNYIANGVGIIFSAIQSNEILSWISWSITLLATLLSIAFTLYRWYKKATEDGKIDKKEIEELGDIVEDATQQIKEKTDGKEDR